MPTQKDDLGPAIADLAALLRGRRAVVLAGAGCSTESGIPDYRGPESVMRARKPIQYGEFVRSEEGRVRYWSRSAVGWRRIAAARPNDAHRALARLEDAGVVAGIITQNVDGLHHAAGSRNVVELHGSLALVRCLGCDAALERAAFQRRLVACNPAWSAHVRALEETVAVPRPDGDAELDPAIAGGFRVPACDTCGGVLKPDVVFFGENVPGERLAEAWRLFAQADVLLVAGSSLTVFSGRRFVYRARDEGVPIAVVNLGPTRGDEIAAVKVVGRLGDVLPRLAAVMAPDGASRKIPSTHR